MNNIYQIIWNSALGQWVVASELSRGKKKAKSKVSRHAAALAICGLATLGSINAYATDYSQVTAGSGQTVTLNSGDRVTGPAPYSLMGLLSAYTSDSKIIATGVTVTSSAADTYGVLARYGSQIELTDTAITSVNLGISASENASVTLTNGSVTTSGADAIKLASASFSATGANIASAGDHRGLFATDSTITLTDTNVKTNGQGATALDVNNNSQATIQGGNIVTEGAGSTAVNFVGNSLSMTSSTILTTGDSAVGLSALGGLTELKDGSITTEGIGSTAIVSNGAGSQLTANGTSVSVSGNNSLALTAAHSIVKLDTVDIESTGNSTSGNKSTILATDSAALTVKNSQISASGTNMWGVQLASGAEINLIESHITTTGSEARGISVQDGSVSMTNGSIHSTGTGIQGFNSTLLLKGTTISTTESWADGVAGSMGSSMTLTNLNVHTAGGSSNAVNVNNGGNAVINGGSFNTDSDSARGFIMFGNTLTATDADILTKGQYADGVLAQAGLTTLNGGTITTQGNLSSGLTVGMGGQAKVNGTQITVSGNGSHGVKANYNANIELNSAEISVSGVNASGRVAGILAYESAASVTANNTNVIVSGDWSDGVRAEDGASITLNGGTVKATGSSGVAVRVDGENGASLVTVTDTLLETTSDNASAVSVSGQGKAVLNNAVVNTSGGAHSYGLSADSRAIDGAAFSPGGIIEATNTRISTLGQNGHGAYVSDGSSISLTGGSIHTQGQSAYGLFARASSSWLDPDLANYSAPTIDATGVNITTQGDYAYGALAIADVNAAYLNLDSVTLSTQGEQSFGLMTEGSNATINGRNVQVKTAGVDAAAVLINQSDSAVSTINLHNSSVNSAQSDGMLVSAALGQINLTASTITGGNGNVLNVEDASQLTLNADSTVLNGDLLVSDDSTANIHLGNASVLNGAAHHVTVLNMDDSQWQMSADSDVGSLTANRSVIHFSAPVQAGFKTLTAGNLSGNGSTFVLNTVLNEGDANTQSDKVHVTGNASGNHNLMVNNAGGLGALTVGDGIQVVSIDGTSDGNFKLGNTVSAGAYEYLLYQGGSADVNDWYLRSYLQSPTPGPTPTDNIISYRPEVAGYVAAPSLNQQYGFDTIGTLHERVGDNVSRSATGAWGRIGGQHRNSDADRFSYDTDTWFAQLGVDLYQAKNEAGTDMTAGVMMTLGNQSTDAQDRARSINPLLSVNTGKVDSDAYSLGSYYTLMAQDGSYIDLVGQGTYYRNKYESSHSAKQDAYGMVMSAEVGKPFALGNGWALEPQGQLMYQYLHMEGFNDGVSDISANSSNSGLARGGLRLTYDIAKVKPYIVADVVHRLGNDPTVTIGGDSVTSDFSDSWWQTGAGISAQVADNTSVYADAKYQKGFDSHMEGYSGNLGVKISF